MNNQEQKFYTVTRNGEEIKIPASEFLSTGGLSVPSTPYMPTKNEKDDAERKNTAYADYSGQPSLAGGYQKDPFGSQDYTDDWDMPVQEVEEGGLPSLSNSQLEDKRRLQ